ncbi:hydroxymethylglutaryl-CoA synthase family protein [Streptomyces sp. NPDC048441]|uniref:hydroxymethylglutaryl-CoA synthase family protein n=1 Tax=Streptomyces sp. NPDC048441 TaxID=3365552 RepID=UPI0037153AFD
MNGTVTHDTGPAAGTGRFGIEALDVYGGVACVSAQEVCTGRDLDPGRFGNLMMTRRSVGLPFEDPVTNAVNAARPLLDRLGCADRVGTLITCTESGLDYSKSVASYVHDALGLGRNCRLLEAKQACYSATGALQLAAGYIASGVDPGAKVLIIATDVSLADAEAGYAEPATGNGAVALLVGDDPRVLTLDPGAFGTYGFEVLDTARPAPDVEIADVDQSLLAYLDCFKNSFAHYQSRVAGADFVSTFDHLAMHTPFAGMAKAGHRKLMRELAGARPQAIEADFERRLAPSLVYPSQVGNLFAGSLYLSLASLIDTVRPGEPLRVGLFSYGSGCASEFYSGVIDASSAAEVAASGIADSLAARAEVDFAAYDALVTENAGCLLPVRNRKVDLGRHTALLEQAAPRRPLLALTAVEDFHRRYEWI